MLTLDFTSFPILYTPRLILREHLPSDSQALFALRSSDQVMRYIDREKPKTLADSELAIQTMSEGYLQNKNLVWAIALKENPEEMIGAIGYYRTDFENYRAEIGYMLLPNFWRRGIISEGLNAALSFGFKEMELHSVTANINPANEASRQMLLKHNFVKEAYFRENYYFNGRFLDTEVYALLGHQYLKNNPIPL